MKNILHEIRLARNKKLYTQDYMGDRLNISQKAYSNLENGHTQLSFSRLKEIVTILDMDSSTLFD